MRKLARSNPATRPDTAMLLSLLVLALSFGLRVLLLDNQSLWYDEGVSVVLVSRDLGAITSAAAADIHPPLYYYLLHFWTMLAGSSGFAARFLSVAGGTLLVAVVYTLARRMFGRGTGLTACLLTAIAPFLVYYSQEARMYMQVTLFAALTVYLYCRLVMPGEDHKPQRTLLWTLIVLSGTLTLYSHYFAFTLPVVLNTHYWLLSGQQRRTWRPWLISQIATAVLFLPWVIVSWSQLSGWPSVSEPFGLSELLRRVFLVFNWGTTWDATATPVRELIALIALVLSLLVASLRVSHRWRSYSLVVLWALIPVLTMYFLSLRKPMYNPKFLLLVCPAFLILLALGPAGLGQVVRALVDGLRSRLRMFRKPEATRAGLLAGLAVTVTFTGLLAYGDFHSLNAYYTNPKYSRDNYRGLVEYISDHGRDGDVIVLTAPGQVEIVEYYYRGTLPRIPLPKDRPMDQADTEQRLETAAASHSRVWLVLWAVKEADPNGFVESWLDQHMYKGLNRWFGTVRLCLYETGASTQLRKEGIDAWFGSAIRLDSYELGGDNRAPGQALPVTLEWFAMEPVEERYTTFVHIIDDGELICGQRDSEPGGGTNPTSSWPTGERVVDRYAVPIILGTPPGSYRIEIGLYSQATGARLEVRDASGASVSDRLLLEPIRIDRGQSQPDAADLDFTNRSSAVFDGNLRLLGYSVTALGRPADYHQFTSSDYLHVVLYWQATSPPSFDYEVDLVLHRGTPAEQSAYVNGLAGRASYSTTQWQAEEIVRDQYKMPLTGLAGSHELGLRVRRSGTGGAVTVSGADNRGGFVPLSKVQVDTR